ncbi:lytic polysaccharide monooxygenase [Streptomyces pathocidini]|uniref:lytic polysaccharide monooxygenase n=1 Tax=Streptomyces pathocidini TaxID=1650571 RepID=UPI0033C49008
MSTKRIVIGATAVTAAAVSLFTGTTSAYAHGFVTPDSSACAAGSTAGGDLSSRQNMQQNIRRGYAGAIGDRQSFEALADDFDSGKLDGKIATAGKDIKGDERLNEQTPTMWAKQDFQLGQTVTVGWCFTAPHKTAGFDYYITKNGWDQNKPLTRDSFEKEPLLRIDGHGQPPAAGLHRLQLPKDHTGYHVILAKWSISDTNPRTAFYNVDDINIKGGNGNQEPPTSTGQQGSGNGSVIAPPTTHDHDHDGPTTPDSSLPVWDSKLKYAKGDRVTYNGTTYECVQSYQGNGDPNWINSLALWKPVNG